MDTAKISLKQNPKETANLLSILTHWWTVELFRTGYSKELGIDDLIEPLNNDKSQVLGDRLQRYCRVRSVQEQQHSLF